MEKGGVELLRDYISDQSKKRKLRRDKERKKEDGAWKRMATAGNVAIATSAGEERRKKKKERIHQRLDTARVAGSSAVNQQKQANKVESVEAKEEKTAPVDHEEKMEEADDRKPAAVQWVEDVEEEEDKKPAAKDRATQPQKTKLQGHIVSSQEVNLFAKKGRRQ